MAGNLTFKKADATIICSELTMDQSNDIETDKTNLMAKLSRFVNFPVVAMACPADSSLAAASVLGTYYKQSVSKT